MERCEAKKCPLMTQLTKQNDGLAFEDVLLKPQSLASGRFAQPMLNGGTAEQLCTNRIPQFAVQCRIE